MFQQNSVGLCLKFSPGFFRSCSTLVSPRKTRLHLDSKTLHSFWCIYGEKIIPAFYCDALRISWKQLAFSFAKWSVNVLSELTFESCHSQSILFRRTETTSLEKRRLKDRNSVAKLFTNNRGNAAQHAKPWGAPLLKVIEPELAAPTRTSNALPFLVTYPLQQITTYTKSPQFQQQETMIYRVRCVAEVEVTCLYGHSFIQPTNYIDKEIQEVCNARPSFRKLCRAQEGVAWCVKCRRIP